MKDGQMTSGRLMGIMLIQNSEFRIQNFPKAGIIVSKKLSNKAVIRNKLKRRLRAALQGILPEIHSGKHLVVLPNRRALEVSVADLEEELKFLNIGSLKIDWKLKIVNWKFFYFGTESNPPFDHGWQRKIRLNPSDDPLIIPWRAMACFVYSEQVGEKRQGEGMPKRYLTRW